MLAACFSLGAGDAHLRLLWRRRRAGTSRGLYRHHTLNRPRGGRRHRTLHGLRWGRLHITTAHRRDAGISGARRSSKTDGHDRRGRLVRRHAPVHRAKQQDPHQARMCGDRPHQHAAEWLGLPPSCHDDIADLRQRGLTVATVHLAASTRCRYPGSRLPSVGQRPRTAPGD
jgi:hypothetical protein